MALYRCREPVLNLAWKIPGELAGEIRIVRHAGAEQVVVERQFGVGEQHGKFRPRQGLPASCALGDRGVVGQEFDCAAEQAALLERLHQASEEAGRGHALAFSERERERLQIVVAQDQRTDIVGHRGKQGVTVSRAEASLALGAGQCDLDIDLDVGRIHTGRIVDRVGVELDARLRRFDAAALR